MKSDVKYGIVVFCVRFFCERNIFDNGIKSAKGKENG